jgi:hypothetical protein
MGVDHSELLALPEVRAKLAEALWDSVARAELEPLIKEFVARVERTNKTLQATISRLEYFDEELERSRAEVREAVIRSQEEWPVPSATDAMSIWRELHDGVLGDCCSHLFRVFPTSPRKLTLGIAREGTRRPAHAGLKRAAAEAQEPGAATREA